MENVSEIGPLEDQNEGESIY